MKPTSDERHKADTKPVALYDGSGELVGMWNLETGRAMLGGAFYVEERGYGNAQRGGGKKGGDDGTD